MKLLNITVMAGQNGFTKAMRTICDQYEEIDCARANLNHHICDVADRLKPDLVFIQIQAVGITGFTLQRLKELGAFIINWSGDVREPLPEIYKEMAQWCDLTCFSNMNDVEAMREIGFASEFLQIGYDSEIYTPNGPKVDAPEIIFMGNNFDHFPLSKLRKEMVEYLQVIYGDRFGVYGIGWGTQSFMGDQLGEAAIYRSAKIGINLSHFDYKRYSSDRLFRMMGTGICVLSHNFKGVKDIFPGIGRWDTLDELRELIDWYLENESLRVSAANYGQLLAVTEYTFTHMCQNIKKLYEQYA